MIDNEQKYFFSYQKRTSIYSNSALYVSRLIYFHKTIYISSDRNRIRHSTKESIFYYLRHMIIHDTILPWKKVDFFWFSPSVHLFQLYYLIRCSRHILLLEMLSCDGKEKISSTVSDALPYPGDVLLFCNVFFTSMHNSN
jgi:hypothetical protein